MNWQAITSVAEILGATGVIASLIYLAVQIRQSTKVARSTARQSISESTQASAMDVVAGDDLAKILYKNLDGQELEPHEMLRLQSRCYRDMRIWENVYYQFTQGMLTTEEWSGFRANLRFMMSIDLYRHYWSVQSEFYSQSFRIEMESVLADSAQHESKDESMLRDLTKWTE